MIAVDPMTTDNHKAKLQDYFDGIGFERWAAIYGDTPVSRIRQTVREGHLQMLTQAKMWLAEQPDNSTLLDAGCGTGLFSLMMAEQGFQVTGVDIAPRMVEAAQQAAHKMNLSQQVSFVAGDIESIHQTFDVAACFDVLVHYPYDAFKDLCRVLTQRTQHTLLFTYAPYSHMFALLHWIGGHFPQGNRRTTIQMIRDGAVRDMMAALGWGIRRSTDISHGFYHVKLVEATRQT